MHKQGNMQFGRFIAEATRTEGCEWTVAVDVEAVPPVALALPLSSRLSRHLVEVRAWRASNEAVARRIAAQMNANRDAQS